MLTLSALAVKATTQGLPALDETLMAAWAEKPSMTGICKSRRMRS